jgi:hypothetical protein
MPHYKDGSEAKVGDFVRGVPYNVKDSQGEPREVCGTLISITPGQDACNCMVAFVEELDLNQVYGATGAIALRRPAGDVRTYTIRTDYGQADAFEKIGR